MKKLATIVLTAALCSAASAVQYSKLGIITAAKSAGKWDVLKSWIATAGYTDEWQAAAFFSDQYPQFAQITNAVVASGVATAQEVEAILAAARDTAPDALLAAAYAHDMQSSSGRARWHGGNPVSEYRTNETTRIIERADIYPDGWEFIDPASRRKALTPEEAAARAASRRQTGAHRFPTGAARCAPGTARRPRDQRRAHSFAGPGAASDRVHTADARPPDRAGQHQRGSDHCHSAEPLTLSRQDPHYPICLLHRAIRDGHSGI